MSFKLVLWLLGVINCCLRRFVFFFPNNASSMHYVFPFPFPFRFAITSYVFLLGYGSRKI